MSIAGSVSQLIAQARAGDDVAFSALHQRYWPRIVELARSRLRTPVQSNDIEDVAQQAFLDLFLNFQRGTVPELHDREQLLALLSHIVVCKALNEIRHRMAQRRGGGARHIVSDVLQQLVHNTDHGPLQEAVLQDCYAYYLAGLPDNLRRFAELHLAGLSNREIGSELNCVERTVERKMSLLRVHWDAIARSSLSGDVRQLVSDSVTHSPSD